MRNIASNVQWQQTNNTVVHIAEEPHLATAQPLRGYRSIVVSLVNVAVDPDDNFPLRQVVCGHVHDLFEMLHKCVVIMQHLL
jgi:hypothetical protein